MKNKHTPGKWSVTTDDRIEAFYFSNDKGEEVERKDCTHHTTKTICTMYRQYLTNVMTPEQRVNAKLITHAPIMYELLQGLIKAVNPDIDQFKFEASEIMKSINS